MQTHMLLQKSTIQYGSLIDQPNAIDEAVADAEWVLETFEPRVDAEAFAADAGTQTGNFKNIVGITPRKKDET